MTKSALVDTGPIVAILRADDEHHSACVRQIQSVFGPLLTCLPVVVEAAWILRTYPRNVTKLLDSFTNGPFRLLPISATDFQKIAAILTKYRDLGIQLADARRLFT